MKKMISCLLLLALLLQLAPVLAAPVWAAEADGEEARGGDNELPVIPIGDARASEEEKAFAEAVATLRQAMVNRETSKCISYYGTITKNEDISAIKDAAVAHTGKPKEGDYLKWQIDRSEASAAYAAGRFDITFQLSWYTSAAEEQRVDTKVASVLQSLKLDGKSDYEKVKAIYDYIYENVKYDLVHLGNSAYKKQFTCYGALIDGAAVCQGYALLFYRLCLECGVDCRVIVGEANGGTGRDSHAWNIVKLGGLYYNVDTTFDTTSKSYGKRLLVTDAHLTDHWRNAEFTTAAFYKAYPMAQSDFDPSADDGFRDIPAGAYYKQPVDWAVENDITQGTSPTTFSPGATCTRAQVVTFLWRAKGRPDPGTAANPFTDVPSNQYYYQPVLWAVAQGITAGTSSTTFSPNNPCTRGQVVTFLWRTEGEPKPAASETAFTDVTPDQYYYQPVLWAVEQGITNGISNTTFGPGNSCTRAQIVTFLYRDLAK